MMAQTESSSVAGKSVKNSVQTGFLVTDGSAEIALNEVPR